MQEYSDQLKSELKRADHLFYVSLKYTRTVDVIRSVIERFMNALDVGIEAMLVKKKKKRKSLEIPIQPRKKAEVAREVFADDKILLKYIDFYISLRDILQAKYDRREEYRRHVTMITHLSPGNDLDVDIDLLGVYLADMLEFEEYILGKIE